MKLLTKLTQPKPLTLVSDNWSYLHNHKYDKISGHDNLERTCIFKHRLY